MVVVRACGRMLPRLEAEESLLAADRLSVNRLKPADRRAHLDAWKRVAYPASAPRPRAPRATPDQLSTMGIGVIVEPPRPPA